MQWLDRNDVDVLALQETKCHDDQFPALPFAAYGYEVATHGLSQWNGVAIASRVGLTDIETSFPGQPGWGDPAAAEARAIGATAGGLRVWSLYVPNGRSVDDPHYSYKLDWLSRLRDAAANWLAADPRAEIALVGDWNIAPEDHDVWDISAFEGHTHVSPAERAAFRAVVDVGFADVVRPFAPGPGVYTYWDYKRLRFARGEGMRIDFALASPALAEHVTSARVDREERKGSGASDHVPVVVEIHP